MYLRKRNNKWQCLVKVKGSRVAQTFMSKWDARKWGEKTTSELRTGTWQNNNKLVSMRLKDLLQLYSEKALHKSKRPKILKYEIELLRRSTIGSLPLAALSAVKLANFRDDRLKAEKSTSIVRSYLKLLSRAITIGQRELGILMQRMRDSFELKSGSKYGTYVYNESEKIPF